MNLLKGHQRCNLKIFGFDLISCSSSEKMTLHDACLLGIGFKDSTRPFQKMYTFEAIWLLSRPRLTIYEQKSLQKTGAYCKNNLFHDIFTTTMLFISSPFCLSNFIFENLKITVHIFIKLFFLLLFLVIGIYISNQQLQLQLWYKYRVYVFQFGLLII